MTAPGTFLISKILVPETEVPLTAGCRVPGAQAASPEVLAAGNVENQRGNLLEAIERGTTDGLRLAVNVDAMLIAVVALIALVNGSIGGVHHRLVVHGIPFPQSLSQIFGWIFAPVAWVIGVPWKDCVHVGNLLGTRMSINEFIAYIELGKLNGIISPRSFTIATFALCGFANLSSIGIQIGGIGALAPERRGDLAKLGLRAMIAGTMANLMSASIVGILIG
jgi:CNT family concentrative nucleoside transporter